MALKDLLALVDHKLKDVFSAVVYDPAKDRDALVKRIGATRAKFLAGGPQRGPKDFAVRNDVVEYRPRVGGAPLIIEGQDASYVASERFVEFLDVFEAEVAGGRLDKEIAAAVQSKSAASTPAGGGKVERKRRSDAGRGWSPERRARFDARKARNG